MTGQHPNEFEEESPVDNPMHVLVTAKLIAMLAIFIGSVAVGCAPIVLARCLRPLRQPPDCLYGRLVSLLLCFGGGVLLFTTFLHLLPECRRTFKQLEHSGRIRPLLEYFGIELSEICVCCGFFVVFAVEETVHFVLDRVHRVHDDIGGNGVDSNGGAADRLTAAAATAAAVRSMATTTVDAEANAAACEAAEVEAIHRSMSMRRCADMDEYPNARQPSPPCLSIAHDFNHVLVNGRKLEPEPDESLLGTECPLYVSGGPGMASAPSMEAVSLFDHPTDNSAMYRRSGDADGCGGGGGGHVILTTATATGQSQQSLLTRAASTFSMTRSPTTFAPQQRQQQQQHHAQIRGVLRGLCAVLALSVHGLFEGLAVGLEQSASSVWYMSVAIATHKLVVVFCVGMELIGAAVRPAFILAYVCGFAVVTPVGMAVGMLLRLDVVGDDDNGSEGNRNDEDAFEVVAAVLQAMAAGTLLYVIFFEVLARDRSHPHRQAGRQPPPQTDGFDEGAMNGARRASHAHRHHYHPDDSGFYRLFAIIAGFLVMFVLHLVTHSE